LKVQRGLVREGLEAKNRQIFEIHALELGLGNQSCPISKAKNHHIQRGPAVAGTTNW
jgi:hypothetical protein